MKMTEVALGCVKLVEKHVDLLDFPPDSDDYVFLDYDAKTLRLRYLAVTVTPSRVRR